MGKLADAIKQYKTSPINSPAEREAKETIEKIVEWMKENGHLTKEFKMPRKDYSGKRLFGYYPDEGWIHMGNFIVHESDKESITLLRQFNSNK
jgi:hypothetical protein